MIRTKQQADSHVITVLKQLKSDREKQLRGYQFARLYFDIKEYDVAKRHLSGFLAVKDNSAQAYKLLAQILEAQRETVRAVDAYRRSLELDPQQNDLLLKIGELYCECNISQEVAKVWAEKLEKVFHSHSVVLRLKEKSLTSDDPAAGDNSESLLHLYLTESAANPADTTRWIRLLQLYRKLGRVEEAYSTAVEAESKRLHCRSLAWYRCLVDLLEEYEHVKRKAVDAGYHRLYISALDSLTSLSIEQSHDTADSVSALWSLDRALKLYGCDTGAYDGVGSPSTSSSSSGGARDEWRAVLSEIEAEYWLHCATILLSKARKERLSWREASDLAAACLLISYSVAPPDLGAAWFKRLGDKEKGFYRLSYRSACFRLSQAGHMLNNLLKDHLMDGSNERWMERIREEYCHQQGRERLFNILYTLPQQRDARDQSYLTSSSLVTSFQPLMPLQAQLKEFDHVSVESRGEDLQLVLWTALQYYTVLDRTQPYQELSMFSGLQYDVTNLESASPESLSQLDIRAFLLAAVRCAALRHEQRKLRFDAYRPHLLPLSINERLCTDLQSDWWTSVYQLNCNAARENMGRLRSVLQRGIETVRLCGGAHGMDVELILHLALNFTEQVDNVRASVDEDCSTLDSPELIRVQGRALHYWNHAVQLLEKYDRSRGRSMPKVRLFESVEGCEGLSESEVERYLSEGRLFQALHARDTTGNHERAIQLFGLVNTPDASFQLAMTYKTLAVREQAVLSSPSPRGGESDESSRARQRALLKKSRAALCVTLDRLAGDRYHTLNGRVAEEIDEVESRLRSIDVIDDELNGFSVDESLASAAGGLSIHRGGGVAGAGVFGTPGSTTRTSTLMERMRVGVNGGGVGTDSLTHSTPIKPPSLSSNSGGANNQLINHSSATTSQQSMSGSGGGGRERLRSGGQYQQPSPERLDAQIRSMSYSQDGLMRYLREELRDSRTAAQTLETRVTKLECKVEELTEQLKKLSPIPPPPIPMHGTPSHIANMPPPHHLPPPHACFPPGMPARMVYPPPPPLGDSYAPSPVHFEGPYGGFYPPGLQKPPPPSMMGPPPGGYYGYPVPPGSVPSQQVLAGGQHHLSALRDQQSMSARATISSSTQAEYDYYEDDDDDDDEDDDDDDGTGYIRRNVDTYTTLAQCVDKSSALPPGRSILTGTGRGTTGIQPIVQPTLPAIKPGFFNAPVKAADFGSGDSTLAALLTGGSAGKETTPGQVSLTPASISKLIAAGPNKNNCNTSSATPITSSTLVSGANRGPITPAASAPARTPAITQPLFGSSATPSASVQPVFGRMATPTTSQQPLFGPRVTPSASQQPLFGPRVSPSASQQPLFGPRATPSASQQPLFGPRATPSASQQPLFGPTATPSASQHPLFGPTATPSASQHPLFGPTATPSASFQPSFGSASSLVRPAGSAPASFFPSPSTGAFVRPAVTSGLSFVNTPATVTSGLSFGTPAATVTSGLSFGTPAATVTSGLSFGTPTAAVSATPGSVVSGELNRTSVSDDGDGDMSNPDPQFEAIVTLPVNVELVTGEEDERELFADRTKLYRFSDKQWKERGVGTIKILVNESTGKARIVMRRDQVHKVCANHYIRADMTPELKEPSEKKILTWRATDISDGEPVIEQFCARFKTEDVATLFLQKFVEAIELMSKSLEKISKAGSKSPSAAKSPASSTQTGTKPSEPVKTSSVLLEPISPAAVVNEKLTISSTATSQSPGGKPLLTASKFSSQPARGESTGATVATTKPTTSFGGFTFSSTALIQKPTAGPADLNKAEASASKPANPFASFSFSKTTSTPQGGSSTAPGLFTPTTGPQSQSAAAEQDKTKLLPVVGGQVTDSAGGNKPVFGAAANVQSKSTVASGASSSSSALTSTVPVFGSSSGLSFASLAAGGPSDDTPKGFAVKIPESKVKGKNAFENAGQQLFAASSPAEGKKGGKSKKSHKEGEEDEEDGGGEEGGEYEPSVDFTPLVSLPEVTVVTGEESETKIFGERAKLYRMDAEAKAWKERGIGELKIMKDFTTSVSRIIMRREQVLKLCANHRISSSMKLLPMVTSETSWLWFAQDYAEDDVKHEQLCAKFKNMEQAQQFRDCFEKCVAEAAEVVTQKDKQEAGTEKSEAGKTAAENQPILEKPETDNTGNDKLGRQPAVKSLSEMFKASAGEWECTACYVRNKASATKCSACESAPPAGNQPVLEKPDNYGKDKPGGQSAVKSLGEMFKASAGEWECTACYVRNKASATKCLACEFAPPGASSTGAAAVPPPAAAVPPPVLAAGQQSLSALFKKQDGEWECPACYLKNKPGTVKCVACEAVKPGVCSVSEATAPTSDSTVKFGAQGGFTFGGSGGAVANFSTGFGQTDPTTGGFKFGTPLSPVIKSASAHSLAPEKSTGFSGGLKFGSFTFGAGKSAEGAVQDVDKESGGNLALGNTAPTFKLGSSPLLMAALTQKSDTGTAQSASTSAATSTGGFTFGSSTVPAFSFTPKSDSATTATAGSGADDSIAPSASLFPGAPANASTPKPAIFTDKFSFSGCQSPMAALNPFATPAKLASECGDGRPGGVGNESVVGGVSPHSPQDDSGLYRNSDGEDSHIKFEPVVSLPEKVDLTTGEEEEDTMYQERAKLFRYADNMWKERGVGTVKLLSRRGDGAPGGRVRLVMRRDQVLKLCLNHRVTPDTVLHEMPSSEGKAWTWHADDFSEGQLSHERFAIRFKTVEIASQFRGAVEGAAARQLEARGDDSSAPAPAAPAPAAEPASRRQDEKAADDDDSDDIEIVKVEMPDDCLVALARKFDLPDGFFNYITKSPCKGCIGCDQNEAKFVFSGEATVTGSTTSTTTGGGSQRGSCSEGAVATLEGVSTSEAVTQPPAGASSTSSAGITGRVEGSSSSNLFSGNTTTPCVTASQSLFSGFSALPSFDSPAAFGGKAMFGGTPSATSQPIFGVASPASTRPVFGMAPPSSTQPIFGLASPLTNQPVFGAVKPASNQPLFGKAVDLSFSSLSTGKPVFGAAKLQQEQPKTPTNGSGVSSGSKPPLFTGFTFSQAQQTPSSSVVVDLSSSDKSKAASSLEDSNVSIAAAATSVSVTAAGSNQQPRSRSGEESEEVEIEEEEEEERPMFCKRATLFYVGEDGAKQRAGLVDVRVTEDVDVGGLRIMMKSDSEEILGNHIICCGYSLKRIEKRACEWRAKDFRTDEGRETMFYVEFSSPHAVNDFDECFTQGLTMARQSDLCESRDETSSLYYPTTNPEHPEENNEEEQSGGESQ